MMRSGVIAVLTLAALLAGCGNDPEPLQYGPNPELAQPHRGLLPNMSTTLPS